MAGNIKLINQILAVARFIPNSFTLNNPTIVATTFPRCTNSIKVMVGITAITRNETLTVQKTCHPAISTLNKRNKR